MDAEPTSTEQLRAIRVELASIRQLLTVIVQCMPVPYGVGLTAPVTGQGRLPL